MIYVCKHQNLLRIDLCDCISSSTWEIQDVDGDGKTILDGDCWDSTADPVPPKGALDGLALILDQNK